MHQDDPTAGEDLARAYDDAMLDYEAAEGEEDGAEPEMFELDLDGQVHTLPMALKGAFLRQADYTRKTQELAEHRRSLEAERAAVAELRRAAEEASAARIHLAALDHQLAGFDDIDWDGLAQRDQQTAEALWRKLNDMKQERQHLAHRLAEHEHSRRMLAERETAEAMAETGRVLAREIDGWSPELAGRLTDYASSHGVTLEELAQAADPRVWKILHKAYVADQAGQRDALAKAQAVRPAVQVTGAAAAGTGVRDELGTREWMKRRNEYVRKGR